ncbi:MAG: Ku protein [Chloroflexi bacterium]|nr:Ku protein [Chloroflexota bacterium]
MARSIWSGVITFGLVSIPVKLYPATQDKDVSFHLLHRSDHSRIRFKRFCAAEDEEVPQDELIKAYEVSKEQYVEITDEDLEQLPLPAKHTIELSAFVKSAEIDPIYYEKSYYLEPEETGVKPYALLMKVLEQKKVIGVASVAIRNKESLCALRPLDSSLVLETLHYPDEIREREVSLSGVSVNERELAVAGTLVDALDEPFDPSKYHDHYREALLELIASKTEGREVVMPESEAEGAPVTDLMAALRASIEAARGRNAEASPSGSKPEPERERHAEHKDAPRHSASGKPAAKTARPRKKAAA